MIEEYDWVRERDRRIFLVHLIIVIGLDRLRMRRNYYLRYEIAKRIAG